ncbi:uncharacterized protein TNCV_2304661 [Trichonephila clavipes]|nr:uncharacterized protein TNCV_2304661 [Trichonephila clavipes]
MRRKKVTMNCLTACQTLPWPNISPDFSSIEHVWDILGRRLHLPGNGDVLGRNWSKFGNKYRSRLSGCFITLCYVVWQLASRLEIGQHLIELITL